MKALLLTLAVLATTTPLHAEDPTAILARVDEFRNPLDSFSIDVELTAISGTKSDTQKYRVYGRG